MKQQQKIIIVGGCFDVLHPGHIDFLRKAKSFSNYLILLLEPDEKVKWLKGEKRPVNDEIKRKQNLEMLTSQNNQKLIDEIIILPFIQRSEDYQKQIEEIVNRIKRTKLNANEPNLPASQMISLIKNRKTEEANLLLVPKFYFGITKNDKNQVKNEKIRELGTRMDIEVIEVNELLPEHSTSNIISNQSRS